MTAPSAGLTVVLADEQPLVRDGLRGLFSATTGITVVAEAGTDGDAVRAVLGHRPDVLVLDLTLGAAVARTVRTEAPETAVLVFTALEDDLSIAAALRGGVQGYLAKRAEPADVVRAVRNVAGGAAVFGAGIANRIPGLLLGPVEPFPLTGLGAREREILALAASGIADTAIAHRLGIAPKTVRNQVSLISTKLRVGSRAEAITLARAAGLGTVAG